MITYNHEHFISKAIEGVLMQKTDFPFELVIGEDSSMDRTREICENYLNKYPQIIKLLHKEKNLGVIANFTRTFNACKGDYIAICEGDDYWTDPFKLQQQVDILKGSEEISICFHKVLIAKNEELVEDYITSPPKGISDINDLAKRNFIHTPSCVFRNHGPTTLGNHFQNVTIADYYLHLMNARHGKIAYIEKPMAVYRVHENSFWSSRDSNNRIFNTLDSIKWILLDFGAEPAKARSILFDRYFEEAIKFNKQFGKNIMDFSQEYFGPFINDLATGLNEKIQENKILREKPNSAKALFSLLAKQVAQRLKKRNSLF